MLKHQNLLAAIVVAVALIITGNCIRLGLKHFNGANRFVTVRGLAEREVKADKVTWTMEFKEIGNDPSEMYNTIAEKNKIVVDFLKNGGIKDEEININPAIISDRQADNYGNEIMNYRYKVSSTITVSSSNVDTVRALLNRQTELMKNGVALVGSEYDVTNGVDYEFTGLNKIKPEMVEEATKNARATAEKFAADSGSKLGGIREAYQGQFDIQDRDASTPYIKNVRVVNSVVYELE